MTATHREHTRIAELLCQRVEVTDATVAAFAVCLFYALVYAPPPRPGDGHSCNGPGPCSVCGHDPDFEGV